MQVTTNQVYISIAKTYKQSIELAVAAGFPVKYTKKTWLAFQCADRLPNRTVTVSIVSHLVSKFLKFKYQYACCLSINSIRYLLLLLKFSVLRTHSVKIALSLCCVKVVHVDDVQLNNN